MTYVRRAGAAHLAAAVIERTVNVTEIRKSTVVIASARFMDKPVMTHELEAEARRSELRQPMCERVFVCVQAACWCLWPSEGRVTCIDVVIPFVSTFRHMSLLRNTGAS